jgi:hypothetical protein
MEEIYKPDNVISVLDLFQTSKEGINLFASKVINEVEDGRIDPLKVKLYCKTLEAIADKIDKGTREAQITAAAKYGDKPFMFSGAEVHLTSTFTSYDYSGYSEWNKFNKEITDLKEKMKECEVFLRALRGPIEVLNSETGEVEIIMPPAKSITEGVKVSIK